MSVLPAIIGKIKIFPFGAFLVSDSTRPSSQLLHRIESEKFPQRHDETNNLHLQLTVSPTPRK